MGVLSNLEPKEVFNYFEEICGIPHGSTDTKAISDYVVSVAQANGLKYRQDESNNVIVWKDGTKGYENSAPVMLQGHMDMVCEKESGCDIDFKKDGLRLKLENGIISAEGTTLGGDDGIAVAYALALLTSKDIPHPPIEAVFTVDEEIGMLGAAALDCSDLKSRIMLNMDSEEEGYLLVSCAGGVSATVNLPMKRAAKKGKKAEIKVTGLMGGHSGAEIDKGRGNSNQLMARALYMLSKKFSMNLISINGGLKDNAIPLETVAEVLFDEKTDIAAVEEYVSEISGIYASEYKLTDAGVRLEISGAGDLETEASDDEGTQKAIALLYNMPGGIQRMSRDIEGLVQTSLNMGILKTVDSGIEASFSVRSSVSSEKEELVNRITCLAESLGGVVKCAGEYPAWEYKADSRLRELMVKVYTEQYGKEPVIQALHAGLECGIFSDKLPGLDCVSFGPDMKDIHTSNESMSVASVERTWKYILEILKQLK